MLAGLLLNFDQPGRQVGRWPEFSRPLPPMPRRKLVAQLLAAGVLKH